MFRESGPLGTFGTKINLAYLIGMFGSRVRSDLHYVRKIRNAFAHNVQIDSFFSSPVKEWAMSLVLVDYYSVELVGKSEDGVDVTHSIIDKTNKPKLKTPRGRFTVTYQGLLTIFILDNPPALVTPHV
jgi:hypothetical protein